MATPPVETIHYAALCFGFMAGVFALEAETWPVFLEWAKQHDAPLTELSRDDACELLAQLDLGLDVAEFMSAGGDG